MEPINFPEQTRVLSKPPSMTDEQCKSLAIWNGNNEQCISCWKPNWWDRLRILFGKPIWLWVWSGQTQPPVKVTVDFPFIPYGSD